MGLFKQKYLKRFSIILNLVKQQTMNVIKTKKLLSFLEPDDICT